MLRADLISSRLRLRLLPSAGSIYEIGWGVVPVLLPSESAPDTGAKIGALARFESGDSPIGSTACEPCGIASVAGWLACLANSTYRENVPRSTSSLAAIRRPELMQWAKASWRQLRPHR